MSDQTLMDKIRTLPPEKVAEVEAFVDFLMTGNEGRRLTDAATKLSQDAFTAVWDNPDDTEYDQL